MVVVEKLNSLKMTPGNEMCRYNTLEETNCDASFLFIFLERNVCRWNKKVLSYNLCPSWITWRVEGSCSFASSGSITPFLTSGCDFLHGGTEWDVAVLIQCSCLSSGIRQLFFFSVPSWSPCVLLYRNMQATKQR